MWFKARVSSPPHSEAFTTYSLSKDAMCTYTALENAAILLSAKVWLHPSPTAKKPRGPLPLLWHHQAATQNTPKQWKQHKIKTLRSVQCSGQCGVSISRYNILHMSPQKEVSCSSHRTLLPESNQHVYINFVSCFEVFYYSTYEFIETAIIEML